MTTTAIQPSFLFLWFLTLRWHFESEASWNCLVQTCQEWGFWGLVGKDEGKDQRHPSLHHTACSGKKPKSKIIVLNPFLQFCWVELLFFSQVTQCLFSTFREARLPKAWNRGDCRVRCLRDKAMSCYEIKVTKYIHSALWESWKAEVNRWKSKNQAP